MTGNREVSSSSCHVVGVGVIGLWPGAEDLLAAQQVGRVVLCRHGCRFESWVRFGVVFHPYLPRLVLARVGRVTPPLACGYRRVRLHVGAGMELYHYRERRIGPGGQQLDCRA